MTSCPFRPRALIVFCLALGLSSALAPAAVGQEALPPRLAGLMAPVADRAFVGLFVASATRGDPLCAVNADRPFTPASNAKLLTSATALATLGPDYRFKTTALATGACDACGLLRGDLFLRGGGDPVLMPEDLALLARRLQAAGVRQVCGRLVADDSRFDDHRLGSGWAADDEGASYSAQISALGVNRNAVQVTVAPGSRVGAPVSIAVEPLSTYLQVDNQATTADRGSSRRLEITRARARNLLVVRGALPLGGAAAADELSVEDPAFFTTLLFRKALAQVGIAVAGATTHGKTPAGARALAAVQSPSLAEIAALMNKPSDNLIAETLLKAIGVERRGEGSAVAGLEEVAALLHQAGADEGRVDLFDGSGLSRRTLVTPRAIAQLLLFARGQPWFSAYYASLPIAGEDGTLRRRLTDAPARGAVRAKTGTIMHTSALSGYVRCEGGEDLVFAIMTNNYPGSSAPVKRMEDQVAAALAAFRRP